ncbi:MAG: HD domain-containing phosphohydrolase [Candidatus Omnitrophota bacterium]
MAFFGFLIIIISGIAIGFVLSSFFVKKVTPKTVLGPTMASFENTKLPEQGDLLERKLMLQETLSIIERLSKKISSSLNLKELAKEIVKTVDDIMNVQICTLLLIKDSGDSLNAIASSGIDEKFAEEINIMLGDEISGAVAKFNEAKIINNFQNESKLYNLKYDKCYVKSLMSVPLFFQNKVLGVLNLSNRKNGLDFSAADLEVVKIIALESALALHNFKLFRQQQKDYLNTIVALANAIDAKDQLTYLHSNSVTKYAVRLAEECKLPAKDIEDIRHAGLLHDIGKIGIKDEILTKPGVLNEEEYKQIKSHPVKGEEIIRSLPFLQAVAKIIRHHHERFDGKGYPDAIKGEKIPLGSRILAIADAFDAMASKRWYRKILAFEEAKEELNKNKGTQFDPQLVNSFISILEKEPGLMGQ